MSKNVVKGNHTLVYVLKEFCRPPAAQENFITSTSYCFLRASDSEFANVLKTCCSFKEKL